MLSKSSNMNQSVFRLKVRSILNDNQFDREVKNKRSGKLHFASLYKISFSSKLFKQKEARQGKIYNVSLMIDMSGSMSGSRINLAIKSMVMLYEALCKEEYINLEICAFNGCPDLMIKAIDDKKMTPQELERVLWGTWRASYDDNTLRMAFNKKNQMKIFNARVHSRAAFDKEGYDLGYGLSSTNYDGIALDRSYNRIKDLPGNNMIIMMSDGEPCDSDCYYGDDPRRINTYVLKNIAQHIHEKTDVDLFSIGIQNRSVLNHYNKRNTKVIDDPSELYNAVVSLINRNIKRM